MTSPEKTPNASVEAERSRPDAAASRRKLARRADFACGLSAGLRSALAALFPHQDHLLVALRKELFEIHYRVSDVDPTVGELRRVLSFRRAGGIEYLETRLALHACRGADRPFGKCRHPVPLGACSFYSRSTLATAIISTPFMTERLNFKRICGGT